MSHDYKIAVEHGSTMVRVGTTIFGPRILLVSIENEFESKKITTFAGRMINHGGEKPS